MPMDSAALARGIAALAKTAVTLDAAECHLHAWGIELQKNGGRHVYLRAWHEIGKTPLKRRTLHGIAEAMRNVAEELQEEAS